MKGWWCRGCETYRANQGSCLGQFLTPSWLYFRSGSQPSSNSTTTTITSPTSRRGYLSFLFLLLLLLPLGADPTTFFCSANTPTQASLPGIYLLHQSTSAPPASKPASQTLSMPSTTSTRRAQAAEQQFVTVTRASKESAQAYLRSNNYNLDAALNHGPLGQEIEFEEKPQGKDRTGTAAAAASAAATAAVTADP
ncbi:hypothetical protein VTJ04DRAFT_83 [Mycothermus thermophilus]|uniref:uncharacterized protein n=1 Tax=Humicola insolens TaxID=85995 RepID=UPI00374340C6